MPILSVYVSLKRWTKEVYVEMRWKVSEAKQQFSTVVRAAAEEPQLIYNRDRLVAAVIDGETLEEFEIWRRSQRASLGERLAELHEIAIEESYVLDVGRREDRVNAFIEFTDDVPG